MKIAVIDVGTNSFHLAVAHVGPGGEITIVDRAKDMVRLGESAFRAGVISPEAFARGVEALRGFRRIAERHAADAVVAVATSAVREAANGGEFVRVMRDETGIDLRVIGGAEEARLIYLGARASIDFGSRRGVVVDIGGGSVELIVADAREAYHTASLRLGVLRLGAERVTTDPISPDERARLTAHIHRILEQAAPPMRRIGYEFVAMTSGTANAVGDLVLHRLGPTKTPPPKPRRVAFKDVLALEEALTKMPAAERARLPLDPKRLDSIVPGVVVVRAILEVLHADEMVLCEGALREGLVADYVAHNRPDIQLVDEFPDARRRSVVGLARRCGYHVGHAEQTARLALALFRGTRALHGLPNADGELLEFASLLHEIGYHIAAKGHHKHGAYLVANTEMKGFSDDDVKLLAQLVRYHRKATPREAHAEFAALAPTAKRKVRILSALLRVACGLDRSYQGHVRELVVTVGDKAVQLGLTGLGDLSLEVWGARRKGDLFEEVFGRKLKVSAREAEPVD